MSKLQVNEIEESTAGHGVHIPGHVVQVVSATKTDTQTISGTTFVDVLTASITPKFATSKIYILCDLNITAVDNIDSEKGARYSGAKLYRDSTQIAMGDAASNRTSLWFSSNAGADFGQAYSMHQSSGSFYDSPATTSGITYKVKCGNTYSGVGTFINRSGVDNDVQYSHRGVSTLTLMEIAQ